MSFLALGPRFRGDDDGGLALRGAASSILPRC